MAKTDTMLSHNWGDPPLHENHSRVSIINKYLQHGGLSTWFDEEQLDPAVLKNQLTAAIENTHSMLVFITQQYQDKLNSLNPNDMCYYEFNFACHHLSSRRMIPILMEKGPKKWKGRLAGELGQHLHIDMSEAIEKYELSDRKDDELLKKKCQEIHNAVIKIKSNQIDSPPATIAVLGRTGDGKSTLCNLFLKVLQNLTEMPTTFGESASASSHTHFPQEVTIDCYGRNVTVIDFPGLLDSRNGSRQDIANITMIVEYLRAKENIQLILLVVNEQDSRFDHGLQAAVKLIYDSFGPLMITNCGFVFTKHFLKSPEKAREWLDTAIFDIMRERGMVIRAATHIPFWQVNSRPEEFEGVVLPAKIDELHTLNENSINDICNLAFTKFGSNALSVKAAKIGEYDEQRIIRENEAQIQILAVETEKAKKNGDELSVALLEAEKRRANAEIAAAQARAEAAAARATAIANRGGGGGGGGCILL